MAYQLPATITVPCEFISFNFDKNPDSKAAYRDLCKTLEGQGYKKWSIQKSWGYVESEANYNTVIKSLGKKGVTHIETKCLWADQFNTTPPENLRIHEWIEFTYENKDIVKVFYITKTEELEIALKNVYVCGFCGNQTVLPSHEFCTKCAGSKYMEKKNIPLTLLMPLAVERLDYMEKTKKKMIERYYEQNGELIEAVLTKRVEEQKARIEEKYRQERRKLDIERKGKLILSDLRIDLDNVIYYSHNNTWCFGWRTTLTASEVEEISKKLDEARFPYEVEYKSN